MLIAQCCFHQVLTPIVSLELDELPATRFNWQTKNLFFFNFLFHRSKNQNQRDDVDFFFNENNNRGGGGPAKGGLVRQDSKDSIDNYFKVSKANLHNTQ